MTRDEIEELARTVDAPSLAEEEAGMVTQVWEDGEITLQKCGALLWRRTLHMTAPGVTGAGDLGLVLPHRHGDHSYAFVTPEDAYRVRAVIHELAGHTDPDPYRPYRSVGP